MALIVAPELAAESFISVSASDAYHAARGNTAWGSLSVTAKEQALRRATDYIESHYAGRWRGEVLYAAQRLSWPRYGAWVNGWLLDSAVLPNAVLWACAELALRSTAAPLYTDVEPRMVKSEKVGPIAVEYAQTSSDGQTMFPLIDEMLSRYLVGGRNTMALVRG